MLHGIPRALQACDQQIPPGSKLRYHGKDLILGSLNRCNSGALHKSSGLGDGVR